MKYYYIITLLAIQQPVESDVYTFFLDASWSFSARSLLLLSTDKKEKYN